MCCAVKELGMHADLQCLPAGPIHGIDSDARARDVNYNLPGVQLA